MNKDFFRQTAELFLFWNGLHATELLWAKVNRPGPWRENRKMSVQFFTNKVERITHRCLLALSKSSQAQNKNI